MNRLAIVLLLIAPCAAYGQSLSSSEDEGPEWHATASLSNVFDGNINHELTPTRSVGIIPAMAFMFTSSQEPALLVAYEVASNSYSGTDEWDRISHNVNAVWSYRAGSRFRFETSGSSSWKGSSEDRELANEFGVSQRVAYRIVPSTRLIVSATYRYKQYPDEPETSGPSPYVTTKLDRKFATGARLSVGYKYQTRHSQSVRDRYRRSAYTLEYSRPITSENDRLSLEAEFRLQRYERLIKVEDRREWRVDRRFLAGAMYERPINGRSVIRWMAGVETRDSNDPDKHFFAPTFGMNISYRFR